MVKDVPYKGLISKNIKNSQNSIMRNQITQFLKSRQKNTNKHHIEDRLREDRQ